MVRAYQAHDASYDGIFFTAVKTTGVFCRPSCRPPRLPLPENVEFFANPRQAVDAGYRPCKLCTPDQAAGKPPDWIQRLIAHADAHPDSRLTAAELRTLSISPERTRRWFVENRGMTFTAWLRGRRLSKAHAEIKQGAPLDDVVFGHGFESHSGFREAFTRAFGTPPGRALATDCMVVSLLESPMGRLIAAANTDGITELLFLDRHPLEATLKELRERHSIAVMPGTNAHLDQLTSEVQEYFEGRRQKFTVPLAPMGTPFQQTVWRELKAIPYGQTISYQALAERIGQPTAMRAVARANGDNPLTIVVPCHRVIGKDGTLTGYGGGLWRKRLLLHLETKGRLPE